MKRVLLTLLFATGCFGAHRDDGVSPDGGTGDDAPPPVTCGDLVCDDVPAATCADQDTLTTYEATCEGAACSYPSTTVECGAAGCCGDHCCSAQVSNGTEFGGLQPTGLVIGPPNGTFNTSTDCTATSALGMCSVVPRTELGLGEVCVCRMDELTIGSLEVVGSRALAILASRSVVIQTKLDVSANKQANGPGVAYQYTAPATGTGGAAGGSYGTRGGKSGNGTVDTVLAVYGDPTLIPLLGGMSGQASDYDSGGGGGALQITAGARITVNGVIDAGGGGGNSGANSWTFSGGAGGGSGGGILLEAPIVAVMGAVVANGGGGGGGGNEDTFGGDGGDGSALNDSGYSGFGNHDSGCALNGGVSGGDGGAGSRGDGTGGAAQGSDYNSGCLDDQFVGGGGGGGGAGRIRVNTATGCQCNGTFSPTPSFGTFVVQ